MRIAAVDDATLQLELFVQALAAMGHVCHTFTTAAALLKALRRESFDLLIVDWQLPDLSGPEISGTGAGCSRAATGATGSGATAPR